MEFVIDKIGSDFGNEAENDGSSSVTKLSVIPEPDPGKKILKLNFFFVNKFKL